MTHRPGIGRVAGMAGVAGAGARRHEAGRGDRDGTRTDVVPPTSPEPAGGIA
jgi:hypothetical protein